MMRRSCLVFLLFAGSACAQAVERVSLSYLQFEGDDESIEAAVDATGNAIAFTSYGSTLVPRDRNLVADVFVRDRAAMTTVRVSVSSQGVEALGESWGPSISADGRVVAFSSEAANLVAADTNGVIDVFVHELVTGTTERISVSSNGVEGDAESSSPSVSANGRFVAFVSEATNLVPGDTNGWPDVFVRDRQLGTTVRVSLGPSGAQATRGSFQPRISADARFVVFVSDDPTLVAGDTNARADVFRHEIATGVTERVSLTWNGAEANEVSVAPSISANGDFVAFESVASNLVPGDTNGLSDVFVRDLVAATTFLVTRSVTGSGTDGDSFEPSISDDGRFVAFTSEAANLVTGDLNTLADVFLHDRARSRTVRVNLSHAGLEANADSGPCVVSGDGRHVVFPSEADNLVSGDFNGVTDVFLFAHCPPDVSAYGVGLPGTSGTPDVFVRTLPILGTTFALDLTNSSGANTSAALILGTQAIAIPILGGTLLASPDIVLDLGLPSVGLTIAFPLPGFPGLACAASHLQLAVLDPGAAQGIALSDGKRITFSF